MTGRRPAINDTHPFIPSPVRPIPLVDEARVSEVLDLAVRIGEVNLASGMGASDTAAIIALVAAAYGLSDLQVDVTYNSITATVDRGPTKPPVSAIRVISSPVIDFNRLNLADRLVRSIRRGVLTPQQARTELDRVAVAEHPHRAWVATLGWAVMAAAATLLLGGNLLISVISFFTTIVIHLSRTALDEAGLPQFFQQVVGGALATIPALVLYNFEDRLGISVSPSTMIAAGVIVLLAGLSLVGAVQDAITRYPLTAAARTVELVIMTGGIVAGVASALRFAELLGLRMPILAQVAPPDLTTLPLKVIAGAILAAAFAVACYAHRRSLGAAAAAGAIGASVQALLLIAGLGTVAAASIAATLVGFIGGLLARRALTPPLIIALAGVTPLLPGLAIYRGLFALMTEQHILGISSTISAIGIATALAAGVTLGEWLARQTRSPRILKLASEVAVAAARSRLREVPAPYRQHEPLPAGTSAPTRAAVSAVAWPRPTGSAPAIEHAATATEHAKRSTDKAAAPTSSASADDTSIPATEHWVAATDDSKPGDDHSAADDTAPADDSLPPTAPHRTVTDTPIGAIATAYSEHPYMRELEAVDRERSRSTPSRRR